MKKNLLIIIAMSFLAISLVGCSKQGASTSSTVDDVTKEACEANSGAFAIPEAAAENADIITNFIKQSIIAQSQGTATDVTVSLEALCGVAEFPGHTLYEIIIGVSGNEYPADYIISDGVNIVTSFGIPKTPDEVPSALSQKYMSKLSEEDMSGMDIGAEIDPNMGSLFLGKADASNKVFFIEDFECPYCKVLSDYIHSRVTEESAIEADIAFYMIALPLDSIHPKATVLSKIFVAALELGVNLNQDIYALTQEQIAELSEDDLIDMFAEQVQNPSFKVLVNSDEVANILAMQKDYAINTLKATSTPHIFINGKGIVGADLQKIDTELKELGL